MTYPETEYWCRSSRPLSLSPFPTFAKRAAFQTLGLTCTATRRGHTRMTGAHPQYLIHDDRLGDQKLERVHPLLMG